MLRTIWNATHMYAQADTEKSLVRRTKFLIRALLQYPYSARWFQFLAAQPELAAVLPQQPQWLHKLQRPYLCTSYGTRAKLRLLQQHYALFLSLFPSGLRTELLGERSVVMARIEGKSGASYRIELSLTHMMDKEGELMLTLIPEATQERLATLAFSFGQNRAGNRQILLGCLQGPSGGGGRERFREVTKDLHGLMPKTLLVKTLCAQARLLEIDQLLAVSNRGHVHNSRLHGYNVVNSDYDALWDTLGGTPLGKHFYLLSSHMPERALSEIPSNKRAQYQRRHAVEARIEAQCAVFLADTPKPSSEVKPTERAKVLPFVTRVSPILPGAAHNVA